MRADSTAALLVLLGLAVVAAVLAAPAVANHGDEANYTVQPEDAPDDRMPGGSGATYDTWVEVEKSYENVTRVTYRLPEEAFYDCKEDDIRAFGIDRGGTHSGLETDEQPPAQYKAFDGYYFEYEVDGTFDLSAGDEIVASVADCLYNPEEKGWYQGQAFLYVDHNYELQSTSHYYWICDCENESEAREQLGPPPSETSSTPTPTPTEEPVVTPTETATPTPDETPTETATPDETPEPTATETATPTWPSTPAPTPTETATATATPADESTPTPTQGTATTGAAPEQTPTPTATSTDTPMNGAPADVRTDETDDVTPGMGPGFGGLAALLAIATGALLARRRG